MVDIDDMHDIFFTILNKDFLIEQPIASALAKRIRIEVSDFVEAQQTIKCANCKGRKFKFLKEPWQVG